MFATFPSFVHQTTCRPIKRRSTKRPKNTLSGDSEAHPRSTTNGTKLWPSLGAAAAVLAWWPGNAVGLACLGFRASGRCCKFFSEAPPKEEPPRDQRPPASRGEGHTSGPSLTAAGSLCLGFGAQRQKGGMCFRVFDPNTPGHQRRRLALRLGALPDSGAERLRGPNGAD